MNYQEKKNNTLWIINHVMLHPYVLLAVGILAFLLLGNVLLSIPHMQEIRELKAELSSCTVPVDAVVEKTERKVIYHYRGSDEVVYSWVFRYTYNGQEYHSTYPLKERHYKRDDNMAKTIKLTYDQGTEMTVYVNPSLPSSFRILNDPLLASEDRACRDAYLFVLPMLLTVAMFCVKFYLQRHEPEQYGPELELTDEETAEYEQWKQEHPEP